MKVDTDLILKLEKLARLELSTAERDLIKNDLGNILNLVDKLQSLDTQNVEPLIYLNDTVNNLRTDEVHQPITREEALKNAPLANDTFFKVPKVIKK